MNTQKTDEKENKLDTELVKEKDQNTRNYIFQNNKLTRSGTIIIVILLLIAIVGIVVSGVFFEAPTKNP